MLIGCYRGYLQHLPSSGLANFVFDPHKVLKLLIASFAAPSFTPWTLIRDQSLYHILSKSLRSYYLPALFYGQTISPPSRAFDSAASPESSLFDRLHIPTQQENKDSQTYRHLTAFVSPRLQSPHEYIHQCIYHPHLSSSRTYLPKERPKSIFHHISLRQ